MSHETQHQRLEATLNHIPPFWIRPTDDQDRSIDPRVTELARHLWPWAFRHVEKELHDAPSAAETLEAVVIEVSSRLRVAPEVARNLNGYLITAFHHRVRARRLREHRIALAGLADELERSHGLVAPDSFAALEWRMMLDLLLCFLPHEIRHTLHLRMLGFLWREIGSLLGISMQQAKSRYYKGLEKAYGELIANQFRRKASGETN